MRGTHETDISTLQSSTVVCNHSICKPRPWPSRPSPDQSSSLCEGQRSHSARTEQDLQAVRPVNHVPINIRRGLAVERIHKAARRRKSLTSHFYVSDDYTMILVHIVRNEDGFTVELRCRVNQATGRTIIRVQENSNEFWSLRQLRLWIREQR